LFAYHTAYYHTATLCAQYRAVITHGLFTFWCGFLVKPTFAFFLYTVCRDRDEATYAIITSFQEAPFLMTQAGDFTNLKHIGRIWFEREGRKPHVVISSKRQVVPFLMTQAGDYTYLKLIVSDEAVHRHLIQEAPFLMIQSSNLSETSLTQTLGVDPRDPNDCFLLVRHIFVPEHFPQTLFLSRNPILKKVLCDEKISHNTQRVT